MSKKLLVIVVTLGLVGAGAGIFAKPAPKKLSIVKCGKKRSAVTFDHDKHAKGTKIPCKSCHHKNPKEVKPCASCHGGKAKSKKHPGCAEASKKKNPYHITCIGCHKKQKKGPKTCKACHK